MSESGSRVGPHAYARSLDGQRVVRAFLFADPDDSSRTGNRAWAGCPARVPRRRRAAGRAGARARRRLRPPRFAPATPPPSPAEAAPRWPGPAPWRAAVPSCRLPPPYATLCAGFCPGVPGPVSGVFDRSAAGLRRSKIDPLATLAFEGSRGHFSAAHDTADLLLFRSKADRLRAVTWVVSGCALARHELHRAPVEADKRAYSLLAVPGA
jgi:hypothetical protein